ncbi:MAG: gliding motility-associated C-terminal domain-containing protein [Saprospiraceae bacterium]
MVGLFVLMMSSLQSATAKDISFTKSLNSEALIPTTVHLSGGSFNTGDKVCLDITVEDFDEINGFNFSITWNETVLRFDSVDASSITLNNFDPSFVAVAPDTLITSWANPAANAVTLADGTLLATLCFTAIGPGNANFVFPLNPLISDGNGNATPYPRQAYDVNLEIAELAADAQTVTVTGVPLTGCGNANKLAFFGNHVSGLPGTQVCVDITAEKFIDIVSLQWTFQFDSSVVRYDTAIGVNLPDFLADEVIGTLPQSDRVSFAWFKDNGVGVSIPDCEVLFQLCFEVVGQLGDSTGVLFTDLSSDIQVWNEGGTQLDPDFYNGSVLVGTPSAKTIRFSASNATAEEGNQACVDVTVNGFTDITEFTYSMGWNEAVLDYVEVRNFGLTGLDASDFDISGTGSGELSVSWGAPGGTPVTLANGTRLYQVCYTAVGPAPSSSNVNFPNTPVAPLVVDADMDTLNFTSRQGTFNIVSPPGACGSIDTISFYMGNETVLPGGQICVPVSVSQFTDVVSLQFSVNYDETLLRFDTAYGAALPGFTIDNVLIPANPPGALAISWVQPGLAFDGITLNECEVIFYLCFTALGPDGTTVPVDFSANPTPIEVSNADEQVILGSLVGFENGSVKIEEGGPNKPNFRVSSNTTTVEEGMQTCLNVTVSGFNNITEFQYSNNWNENLLEFVNVRNFNLAGLTASNFDLSGTGNGDLSVSWDAPGGTPVTLANGIKIYETCFTAVGAAGSTANMNYSGTPVGTLAVDADNDTLNFTSQRGTVNIISPPGACGSIDTISFYLGNEVVMPGQQVCLPVRVSQFTDIISIQFSVNYDETLLRYDTSYGAALPGFTNDNVLIPANPPGALTVSWVQPGTAFDGVTLNDCEIAFYMCFTALGPDGTNVPVDFSANPTSIEISNSDEEIVMNSLFGFENGSVNIQDNTTPTKPPFTIAANDKNVVEGNQVCLDVTANGFTNVERMNYSQAWDPAMLEFSTVQNFGLTGLDINDFSIDGVAGNYTVDWTNTPGVTLANGTKLYEVCFNAIGAAGNTVDVTFENSPLAQLVVDSDGDTLMFQKNDGSITIEQGTTGGGNDCGSINSLSFFASTVDVKPDSTVCVPIRAFDFEDIVSFQFSVQYDHTLLEFVDATTPIIPGFDVNNVSMVPGMDGVLTISWVEPGLAFDGETIPDCEVLFNLCFKAIGPNGSTSQIDLSGFPTPVEVSDANQNVVLNNDSALFDGAVNITMGTTTPQCTVPAPTITNVACRGGNTGNIDFTLPGGSTLMFNWAGGSTDVDRTNLTAGNYTVTISGSGCTAVTKTYTVMQPATALTSNVDNVVNNDCFAGNDGAIDVSATGGWGNYTYRWSPMQNGMASISGLQPGSYTVTITDSGLCRDTLGPIMVTSPPQLRISTALVGDVTCAGLTNGIIDLTVMGGTQTNGYTYTWSNGLPSTRSQSNLGAGTYSVTIEDDNMCQVRDTFVVNTSPAIVAQVVNVMQSTNGNNGSIDITPVNGTPPYTYQWNGPNMFSSISEDISGLAPGTYTVVITDVTGCSSVAQDIPVQGNSRTDDVMVTNTCPGTSQGSITVTVSGYNNPTIRWDSGPGNPTGFNPTGLPAGSYTYRIFDDGIQRAGPYTVTINAFPTVTINETVTDERLGMNDGSIQLQLNGGVGPFTYSWNPVLPSQPNVTSLSAGNYNVTVTDTGTGCTFSKTITVGEIVGVSIASLNPVRVSCNGENDGQIVVTLNDGEPNFVIRLNGNPNPVATVNTRTYTITGLTAGTYMVEVTDGNGLVAGPQSVTVSQPAAFSHSVSSIPRTEDDLGRVDLTVNGGTPPYSFLWSNGATTEDLFDVREGCYKATVTDSRGCVFVTQEECVNFFKITNVVTVNVKCPGDQNGSIQLQVFGGNEPYTYNWRNELGELVGVDSNLMNIPAGIYTVQIVGTLGTVINRTYEVISRSRINAEALPLTNFGGYNVTCADSENGRARVTAMDGVITDSTYSYLWSTGARIRTIDNLGAGTYTVTVIDNLGCEAVAEVDIIGPPPVESNFTTVEPTCFGRADGSISIFPSGGVGAPYQFEWDNPSRTTQTIRNLTDGVYSVTISDANECEMVEVIELNAPDEILVSVITTDDSGAGTGTATAIVNGGTAPYTYQWSNGATNNPLLNLFAGNYSVLVTDANGCTAFGEEPITNGEIQCLTARTVITPDGDGLNEELIFWCLEDYPIRRLQIFNRWGQQVFETEEYNNDWAGNNRRGEPVPEGAYFYVLEYSTTNGGLEQLKGSFTLLRDQN